MRYYYKGHLKAGLQLDWAYLSLLILLPGVSLDRLSAIRSGLFSNKFN